MRADCKDAMTTQAPADAEAPSACPEVWDAQRLATLLADVGETGLRDILRLFQADLPYLLSRYAEAVTAGNESAALQVIALLQDSADALGLAALGGLAREIGGDPLAPGNRERLADEAARIRFIPPLKQAS